MLIASKRKDQSLRKNFRISSFLISIADARIQKYPIAITEISVDTNYFFHL